MTRQDTRERGPSGRRFGATELPPEIERVVQQAKRLEWGADEGYYSGWMQMTGEGDRSDVTVHISLRGKPPGAPDDGAPSRSDVQEGLQKGLESIKNYVEGHGGKEEPAAAT